MPQRRQHGTVESLVDAVAPIVGRENVILAAEAEAYAWDALGPERAYRDFDELSPRPLLVARPHSTAEVSAIVRLAAERRMPVVAHGGGSGLMGGAIPIRPSLVIDLTAMDRIVAISRQDHTAAVEAGVVLETLERELRRHGLILGHDPWSLPLATVGGGIATDSLGYRGARYGSMGDQVLGLTAVLPDGRIVRTRAPTKASVGFDVKRLFVGSEGCLGIVTEATLRVFSLPEKRLLRAYEFPSFEDGFQAVLKLRDIGLTPALLDYGESWPAGDAEPAAPTLYLGFEGCKEEVAAQGARARGVCKAAHGHEVDGREARRFWNQRHAIARQFARRRKARGGPPHAVSAGFDYVHVSLPASRVLEYRRGCDEIARQCSVRPLEYGIWCWPELFSVVITGATTDGGRQPLARAVDEMLALAQDLGGAMEYCHGVGVRLAHLMAREQGEGLEVMRAVKRALDPDNVLNPGKLGL
jgi:FAD/FMN-containing dehydrogenase